MPVAIHRKREGRDKSKICEVSRTLITEEWFDFFSFKKNKHNQDEQDDILHERLEWCEVQSVTKTTAIFTTSKYQE